MPPGPPPAQPPGRPIRRALPAGTRLWRLHSRIYEPNSFSPRSAPPPEGGRFDAPPGEYTHLYAGEDLHAAVAETLLRQVLLSQPMVLQLPFVAVAGKDISELSTRRDLVVVDLRGGESLAPLGQDAWLTSGPPPDYGLTRAWALAIKGWVPDAVGLAWRPRNDPDRSAYVLFGDRCRPEDLAVQRRRPADTGPGLLHVRRALADYQVAIQRPS